YSSLLAIWRRERANGILEALTPQRRGPKSKRHPMDEENQKLRRQNARLTEDLRKAHIIIDVQKKVAALLGHPIPEQDPEEESCWPPSPNWPPMLARAPLAVRCLRRALPTTGNGMRLLPRQCPRPGWGLRRPVRCVRRNAQRSWRIFTEKDSRIARQPLFMRRCSMKGSITARSAPCIACSNSEA